MAEAAGGSAVGARRGLARVLTLVLTLACAATGETAPPPAFPAPTYEEFGPLLNWLWGADAASRDAFIENAGRAIRGKGSAAGEAESQLAVLRALAREGRDAPTDLIVSYAAQIDHVQKIPLIGPVPWLRARGPALESRYVALLAYRFAQLCETSENVSGANVGLAYVRRNVGATGVWHLTGSSWQLRSADALVDETFRQVNANRLTYRVTHWLAGRVGSTGAIQYLAVVLALVVACRLLSLPVLVKALPHIDGFTRDWLAGSVRLWDALSGRWPYLLAWAVLEYCQIQWVSGSTTTWEFLFDFRRLSLGWVPTLAARDFFLVFLANVSFSVYLLSLLRASGGMRWFIAILLGLGFTYREYSILKFMAWGSLYQLAFWAVGFVILSVCRLALRSRRR